MASDECNRSILVAQFHWYVRWGWPAALNPLSQLNDHLFCPSQVLTSQCMATNQGSLDRTRLHWTEILHRIRRMRHQMAAYHAFCSSREVLLLAQHTKSK